MRETWRFLVLYGIDTFVIDIDSCLTQSSLNKMLHACDGVSLTELLTAYAIFRKTQIKLKTSSLVAHCESIKND